MPWKNPCHLGYELEIIDFDNIKEGDDSRSDEAKSFCLAHGMS